MATKHKSIVVLSSSAQEHDKLYEFALKHFGRYRVTSGSGEAYWNEFYIFAIAPNGHWPDPELDAEEEQRIKSFLKAVPQAKVVELEPAKLAE